MTPTTIILLILSVSVIFMIIRSRPRETTLKSWHHFFDGTQFSAQEFYSEVQKELQARTMPGVDYERAELVETHIFSGKREYLKIKRGNYIFYICAAPFGTGYFFSWRLTETVSYLFEKVSYINTAAGINRLNKTYYQLDAEAMYTSMVHKVVTDVLSSMATAKGTRGLSTEELQYI